MARGDRIGNEAILIPGGEVLLTVVIEPVRDAYGAQLAGVICAVDLADPINVKVVKCARVKTVTELSLSQHLACSSL